MGRAAEQAVKGAHLVWRPATEAVRLIVVESEDLNSSLDAEVMQNAAHLQGKQVILLDKEIYQWFALRLTKLWLLSLKTQDIRA